MDLFDLMIKKKQENLLLKKEENKDNVKEIKNDKDNNIKDNIINNNINDNNIENKENEKIENIKTNEGLFNAVGYNFDGSITYDGNVLTSISGDSADHVIPGSSTRIGGYSIVSSSSTITSPIYVTLTPEQQKHLDKVKVTLYVDEKNIVGSNTGVTSSKDLFDIKAERIFINKVREWKKAIRDEYDNERE